MKRIVQGISYATQLFIIVGVAYLFLVNLKPSTDEILKAQEIAKACPELVLAGDVLSSAQQIGRLDYISLALAVLGVLIALAAFGGFKVLRRETLETAKEHCSELLKRDVDSLVQVEVSNYLSQDKGVERLEALVGQKVSDIIEDEVLLTKLVERLAPLVRETNFKFEQDFGSSTVADKEIEQLLQELAREDEAE